MQEEYTDITLTLFALSVVSIVSILVVLAVLMRGFLRVRRRHSMDYDGHGGRDGDLPRRLQGAPRVFPYQWDVRPGRGVQRPYPRGARTLRGGRTVGAARTNPQRNLRLQRHHHRSRK